MEKIVSESIRLANEGAGMPLFPKIKLKIVNCEVPPEKLENKIVIFVKKENKPFVYSNIIIQSLDKSFLKDSKRHINPYLYDSARFMAGKSLITQDKLPNHLDTFKREALRYYERKMDDLLSEDQVLALIEKEELIIRKRMFKSVFLQELYALGERMIGKIPSGRSKQESIELVDFLYDNARMEDYKRETGVLPPLDFNKNFFKVGLILVKRPELADIANHFKAVRTKIKNGVSSIYILGLGKHVKRIKGDFVDWLKQVATKDYNNEWHIEKIIDYKMTKFQEKDTPGICCIFRHKSWIP